MSAAGFRDTLAATNTPAFLASTMTPSTAAPNTGGFNKSSEGFRKALQEDCNAAWNFMVEAERKAEKSAEAGKMKDSKRHSKEADDWFAYGERKGCGWAQ